MHNDDAISNKWVSNFGFFFSLFFLAVVDVYAGEEVNKEREKEERKKKKQKWRKKTKKNFHN